MYRVSVLCTLFLLVDGAVLPEDGQDKIVSYKNSNNGTGNYKFSNLVKMNFVVLLCCLLSLISAAIIPDEAQAKIVKYENSNDGAGNYRFSYETSNGIYRDEVGYLVNVGKEDEHMVVEGSYSYSDVEGKLVYVKYTADENGFHVFPPETQVTYSLPPSVVATLLGK